MNRPQYISGRRPGDDHIYQEVMSGIYEHNYKLKPGDYVVDAGAHVGFFTCKAAESVGTGGRVFAFEPEPDNYRGLFDNVAGLENVYPCNIALWSEPALLPLYLSGSSAEHSLTHPQKDARHVQVPAARLDKILCGHKCNFIKIDVEGAELHVLRGGVETIETYRPYISMEIEPDVVGSVRKWLALRKYDLIQVTPMAGGRAVYDGVPK